MGPVDLGHVCRVGLQFDMGLAFIGSRMQIIRPPDVEPRELKGRHRRALPAQIAIKRRGERGALDRRLDARR